MSTRVCCSVLGVEPPQLKVDTASQGSLQHALCLLVVSFAHLTLNPPPPVQSLWARDNSRRRRCVGLE